MIRPSMPWIIFIDGLANDFFRVGKGWHFCICRVRQETEHAFFTKGCHTVQVCWFSNWSKVELEVTRTNDFSLWSMNDNPQRFWNRVSRSKESCLEIFKGQLSVVVDFVKFGVAQEARVLRVSHGSKPKASGPA